MANIFDIAKLAGVSKTTVSKVINNQYGVNVDTRKRVLDAIEELKYVPNQAARSLVKSKSGVIGVIYDAFTMPVYLYLAGFLEQYASENGYNLVFCNCNDDHTTKAKYISYFTGGAADGLILFGSDTRDKDLIIKLKETEYPFVVIENHFEDIDINNILIDNIEGARKAVEYLLGLGHKKIVHITGNVSHRAASDRLDGYIRALQSAGLAFDPEYVIYTNAKQKAGSEAAKKILEIKGGPTAIFAFNDVLAYEAIEYLGRKGYKVPHDFSVIGFDNIANTHNFIPANISLTSMAQPMDQVAEQAIKILINNIDKKSTSSSKIVFEVSLFEGKSCKSITIS